MWRITTKEERKKEADKQSTYKNKKRGEKEQKQIDYWKGNIIERKKETAMEWDEWTERARERV